VTGLDAARAGELPGLEAFPAEHRTTLRRAEWNRRFLTARRAVRRGLHPFPPDRRAGRRTGCSLGLARLTSLGLVLEILVGEEELFTRCPDELRAAIHARQRLVLELHRSSLSRSGSTPEMSSARPRVTGVTRRPPHFVLTTRLRGAASCAYASVRAPVSHDDDRLVSDRRSAS